MHRGYSILKHKLIINGPIYKTLHTHILSHTQHSNTAPSPSVSLLLILHSYFLLSLHPPGRGSPVRSDNTEHSLTSPHFERLLHDGKCLNCI